MTLDQILIVMLPADALGEAGKSGRTEKMSMEAAGAAGCDLSKIFSGKSKVQDILERRKQGAAFVDGTLLTKQQQREQRRLEMERRKAAEQAAQGA